MSGLGWFLLIAFSSVALASMTLRAIPRQHGAELVVYLLAIALAALAGLGVAVAIDSSWGIVGAAAGVASIEVGPAIARAVKAVIAKRSQS